MIDFQMIVREFSDSSDTNHEIVPRVVSLCNWSKCDSIDIYFCGEKVLTLEEL